MSWLLLALFSALIQASRQAYEKHLTKSFGNFTMGFIVQFFSLLPTAVLLFFLPIPDDILHLPWQFWWPLLIIWFIIYPIQTHFLYGALREGELTQVSPIKSLVPVFNVITSLLIINERPTILGLVGVTSIVLATYLLLTEGVTKGKGVRYNRAVIFMIASTVCMAIGSTLDKVSITAATPAFYSFMNTAGASIIFLILIRAYKQNHELTKVRNMIGSLTLLGVFQGLAYTASMLAFSYGPTSYVLAVRSSSFLWAALLAVIFLREKISINKLISFILFVIGLGLLIFTPI